MMERRPNWSAEEVKMLQVAVSDRRSVLYSRQIAEHSRHRKKEAWKEIAAMVQSVGRTDRTANECRRKFADFSSRMRKKTGVQRRIGGGMGYYLGYHRTPAVRRPDPPALAIPPDHELPQLLDNDDEDAVVIKEEAAQWTTVQHDAAVEQPMTSAPPPELVSQSPMLANVSAVNQSPVSQLTLTPSATTADLVELERKRLQVEQERLFVERERLVYEKQAMGMAAQRLSVEQQMLIVQQERLAVERERLALETQRLAVDRTRP